MSAVKRIVCLANSRKLNGRCIAGKELEGEWDGQEPVARSLPPAHVVRSGRSPSLQVGCPASEHQEGT